MTRGTPRFLIALVLGLGLLAASHNSSHAALSSAERQDAPATTASALQEAPAVAAVTPAAPVAASTSSQQALATPKAVAAPQKHIASRATEARPIKRQAYATMSIGHFGRRCH